MPILYRQEETKRDTMNTITRNHPKAKQLNRLAQDCRSLADFCDTLADRIEAWGNSGSPTATGALGLVKTAGVAAQKTDWILDSEFWGSNCRCSIGQHHPKTIAYALMHNLSEVEKYDGPTELANAKVTASGVRCHASLMRVMAKCCDDVETGKALGLG